MSKWINIKSKVPINNKPILMAIQKKMEKGILIGMGYKTRSQNVPIRILTSNNTFYWVSCLSIFNSKQAFVYRSDPFLITQNDTEEEDPFWKILAWQDIPHFTNQICKITDNQNRFTFIDINE